MKTLSIDIETFSPEPLAKCGVYRYCQVPEFEVLLFGYSVDSGPPFFLTVLNLVKLFFHLCGEFIVYNLRKALF